MITSDFPGCCNAKIIHELGGSAVAIGGYKDYTEKQIEDYIRNVVISNSDKAMFVATTNDSQTTAIRALKKLGFIRTRWASKRHHKETKVCIWWINKEMWDAKNKK